MAVGFALIALLAVVGTIVAELAMTALRPSSRFAYSLVGTALGLGAGAVVGVALVARYLDRRSLADYGHRGGRAWWRDLVAGLGIATALQTAVVGVELASGWAVVAETVAAGAEGFVPALVASLALFAVVGLYEELVVRGFVLRNVAEGLAGHGATAAVAVAVSSLLFGVVHVANAGASLVAVVGVAVIAITLAASYVVTGRLGLVVDAPGPAAWIGGSFGPEAGALGVLAALAGLVGVLVYARRVEGRIGVHADLLVPTRRGGGADPRATDDAPGSEDSAGANRDVGPDASASTELSG